MSSWGLTEVPVVTSGRLTDSVEKLRSTEGRPLPGVEMRVMDGFYRTGDRGLVDSDGHVTISGRLKDVIVRNGENVAAREVEDLLLALPGITETAVIGLPDERSGESVCAVVMAGQHLDLDIVRSALTAAGLRRQALPDRLELYRFGVTVNAVGPGGCDPNRGDDARCPDAARTR